MADHNLPVLTSTYTDFLNYLDARLDDLALGLATDTTSTATNLPTGSIRWDNTSKYWTRNGTALSTLYNININGTVGATTPAAGSFTTLSTSGTASLAAGSTVGTITIADISSSQTFTNKTLTTPIINGFSGNTSVVSLGTTQFYKDVSGNIGLGTGSPQTQFHVLSSTGPEVRVESTSSTGASLSLRDSASSFPLVLKSAGSDLTFITGNNERLRLNNVGDLILGNGATSATPSTYVMFKATGGSGTNIAGSELWIQGGQSTGSASGGAINFYTSAAGVSGSASNNYGQRMTILSNGNIGIGVVTPTSKLQVGGDITATSYNGGPLAGFRNRVINGNMLIDQRSLGLVNTTVTNALTYVVDRFGYFVTQASKFTVQRNAGSATPPTGSVAYLGVTNGTAYSVLSSDLFLIEHRIEGYNSSDLNWGTANARAVTLSFKVYSSLTGTFGGSVNSASGTYSYPFSYSIPVANTWTTISIQIPGPTAGFWVTTTGANIQINFGLGVGATNSGTAGAWTASSLFSSTGATSVLGTSGATWYVTAVQLETGNVATPIEYRPFDTELALCRRYYYNSSIAESLGLTFNNSFTFMSYIYPVPMRTTPTITGTFTVGNGSAGTLAVYALAGGTATNRVAYLTNSAANWLTNTAVAASVVLDAEL